jgi:hypothetical protein
VAVAVGDRVGEAVGRGLAGIEVGEDRAGIVADLAVRADADARAPGGDRLHRADRQGVAVGVAVVGEQDRADLGLAGGLGQGQRIVRRDRRDVGGDEVAELEQAVGKLDLLHVEQPVRAVGRAGAQIAQDDRAVRAGEEAVVGAVAGEHEGVLAVAALDVVVAGAARQHVVAVAAVDIVVAGAAAEDVVAILSEEAVVAGAAVDAVVAVAAEDAVVLGRAEEGVGFVGAVQNRHCRYSCTGPSSGHGGSVSAARRGRVGDRFAKGEGARAPWDQSALPGLQVIYASLPRIVRRERRRSTGAVCGTRFSGRCREPGRSVSIVSARPFRPFG